jgi:hypothetical protein
MDNRAERTWKEAALMYSRYYPNICLEWLRKSAKISQYSRCTDLGSNRSGFEVLTAVIMKSTIFWDMTPCSPLKFNRRFGGTRLHLRIEEYATQETSVKQVVSKSLKIEATCFSETSVETDYTTLYPRTQNSSWIQRVTFWAKEISQYRWWKDESSSLWTHQILHNYS